MFRLALSLLLAFSHNSIALFCNGLHVDTRIPLPHCHPQRRQRESLSLVPLPLYT